MGAAKVEISFNAVSFYEQGRFRVVDLGHFSHGLDGDPIAIVLMELA